MSDITEANLVYGWILPEGWTGPDESDIEEVLAGSEVLATDWSGHIDYDYQDLVFEKDAKITADPPNTKTILSGLPDAPGGMKQQMLAEAERLGLPVTGDPQWILYCSLA